MTQLSAIVQQIKRKSIFFDVLRYHIKVGNKQPDAHNAMCYITGTIPDMG